MTTEAEKSLGQVLFAALREQWGDPDTGPVSEEGCTRVAAAVEAEALRRAVAYLEARMAAQFEDGNYMLLACYGFAITHLRLYAEQQEGKGSG